MQEQLACACAPQPSPPLRGGEGWGERALFTPLCRGESGTIRPRSGHRHGCRCLFVRTGVRSKSPAPTHELAGHKPGKRQAGWPSLWPLSLTPGILPYALRASFAVRARSRRVRGHSRESGSRSVGGRKLLLCIHHLKQEHRAQGALLQKSNSKGIATEVAPTSEGVRRAGSSWLALVLLAPSPPLRGGEGWGERALFTPLCAKRGGLLFGHFLLLRASCPTPFGPASLFARAPGACVATQEKVARAPQGVRKLLLCTHLPEQKHRAQGALLQKSKGIAAEVAHTRARAPARRMPRRWRCWWRR